MWRLASRLATVNHLIERNTLIHSRMKYKRSWQHLLFTVQSDYSTVTNCTRVVSFFQSFKLYAKAFKRPFQILSHDTSIWSISWYVWLFKPALSQLWVRSHWGRVTGWANLSFADLRKKSYKTLTLMSSAFSPYLTATKVSIADGPFESKVVKSSSDIDINKMA